jgi:TRAP-type C4-dicarboxylate transport system substrate-binding protein
MAFTELFTALEVGSVDGQENPVTLILNARFFEVQKHLTLTQHAFTTGPLVMSKTYFDGLPADLQKTVLETAREMARLQWSMNAESESSSLAALKKNGMQVVESVDRAAFKKVVADEVRKDYVEKFGPELPRMIDAAAG